MLVGMKVVNALLRNSNIHDSLDTAMCIAL